MSNRIILALAALALLVMGCTGGTGIQVLQTTPPVESTQLTEASGMAVATVVETAIWLLNDSGNAPDLFLVDLEGNDLGSTQLSGATNVDWEAMTRFDHADESWLIVADIGDNHARRQDLALYFVREPAPPLPRHTPLDHRLELAFPDGPRDVEAVAVDPIRREILILSKRDSKPRLYSLPLADAMQSNRVEPRFLGTVASIPAPTAKDLLMSPVAGANGRWISQPTGMSIRNDGGEAVILTYKRAYRYARPSAMSWLQAFNQEPQAINVYQLPKAEAVSYLSDHRILVASEGRNQPILIISDGN